MKRRSTTNGARASQLTARIQKAEQQQTLWRIGMATIAGGAVVVVIAIIGPRMLAHSAQPAAAPIVADAATSTPPAPDAYANISLIGKSAIVYDLTNGRTLYAQNAYAQLPLASITKLLTLYAASSVLSPSTPVTMTPVAVSQAGDAADNGFSSGETFKFEDLARLTLAASSNDGAEAIAEAADSARQTDTSSLLAGAAAAVGLTQTSATNSTGLDVNTEVSGGYGSAHDIAVLAGSLLKKDPSIAAATTQPKVSIVSQQGITHSFANTDVDVTHYPNLLLSKTGYTDLAGGNLVIVYDAGIAHPVAVVVLGSTENGRFADVSQLMQATAAHFAGIAAPNSSAPVRTAVAPTTPTE